MVWLIKLSHLSCQLQSVCSGCQSTRLKRIVTTRTQEKRMEADLPGILQITIRTECLQQWKKHKLWNQRCLCSNTNTWSCYLNLLSLNFYICEMRIQCLYHTFVVGINRDNTRRVTSKIPELFYPVPLGRAAIRSMLVNM